MSIRHPSDDDTSADRPVGIPEGIDRAAYDVLCHEKSQTLLALGRELSDRMRSLRDASFSDRREALLSQMEKRRAVFAEFDARVRELVNAGRVKDPEGTIPVLRDIRPLQPTHPPVTEELPALVRPPAAPIASGQLLGEISVVVGERNTTETYTQETRPQPRESETVEFTVVSRKQERRSRNLRRLFSRDHRDIHHGTTTLTPNARPDISSDNIKFAEKAELPNHDLGEDGHLTYRHLELAGLQPRHRISIEGKPCWASDIYYINEDRLGVMLYVLNGDDKWVVRSYYMSHSHGLFKYLAHYGVSYSTGRIGWFGKAVHEGGESLVCAPISVQPVFAKIFADQGGKALEINEELVGMMPDDLFAGTAVFTGRRSLDPRVEGMDRDITLVRETVRTRSLDGEARVQAHRFQNMGCYPENYHGCDELVPPGNLYPGPEDDEPENFANPDQSYRFFSFQYGGMVDAEIFTSKNGKYRYLFFRDKLNRVFPAMVEFADAEIGSTGTKTRFIDPGNVCLSGFEYPDYVDEKYKNPKLRKGRYVDTFDRYQRHSPMVRRYYKERPDIQEPSTDYLERYWYTMNEPDVIPPPAY